MVQTGQKAREAVYAVLQDIDFATYSKQFMKGIMSFLEIEEPKVYQKSAWAEKIVQIYEAYRGQYDIFLTQQKFKHLNSECKDFLWTIFKQYDEKLNQRKYMQSMQGKTMMGREHAPPNMTSPNQNMNMNMVNMFLEVPNFQTVEDIEIFQRKMFEVYKNVLPQVLSGIPLTTQSQYYRGNNPYQYGMGMSNNLGGLSGMSGLGAMGMAGMSGMSGMPVSSMGGLSSMASMSYSNKTPEYYESSSSFPNRYFYDNKMPINFSQTPMNPKPMMNEYKPTSQNQIPSMGFNYYSGDRYNSDEYRGGFKGVSPYSQARPNTNQDYQRKPTAPRFFGLDDQKYDMPYQIPNSHEFITPLEKPTSFKQVDREKQRQFYSACDLPPQHEPRKQVKRDDEISIFNDNAHQNQTGNIQIVCICNNKQQAQKCLYCRIINLDPFNQVESSLIIERVNFESADVHVEIGKKTLDRINKNADKLDIEIRCIKATLDCQHEISWPDKYQLKVDEEIVEDMQGTGLKKRKDKPFIFSKMFGNEKNAQDSVDITFTCKRASSDKQQRPDQSHIYGVFVVNKNNIEKMYDKLIKKSKQQNISQFFKLKQKESVPVEQIAISPFEPSIKKLIKDPVRGRNCTHPQCFDLQIFLSFLIISPNRQWKCPICNKDAKQIIIDKEIKSVLSDISKMIKQPKEIIFYSNGSHELRYESSQGQSGDHGSKESRSGEENDLRKQNKLLP